MTPLAGQRHFGRPAQAPLLTLGRGREGAHDHDTKRRHLRCLSIWHLTPRVCVALKLLA